MAKKIKRRVVTSKHLFRYINGKPLNSEISLLEKAIFHSFKLTFEDDPTGKSLLRYDGKPVVFKNESGDLKDLFKKIVNCYSTI